MNVFFRAFILFFLSYSITQSHEKKFSFGVRVGNISNKIVNELNLDNKNGAIILNLLDQSAARASGLIIGDIIFKIDHKDIKNYTDVIDYIGNYEGAGKILVTFLRGKNLMQLYVILREK